MSKANDKAVELCPKCNTQMTKHPQARLHNDILHWCPNCYYTIHADSMCLCCDEVMVKGGGICDECKESADRCQLCGAILGLDGFGITDCCQMCKAD